MNEYVGNEQAMMAEFADNLWKNYIKPKYEATRQDKVSYYRATVISNNGDGTLTVRPACDNERTVNHTSELSNVEAGAEVVVWKLGNGNAAMNHLAVLTYSDGGGGTSDEWGLDVLLGGVSGSVQQNTISVIRSHAAQTAPVTEIYAENVRIIDEWAFFECFMLSTVRFPECRTIGEAAFYHCRSLSSAFFPKCATIGDAAFYYCSSLTSISFPACAYVGHNAFSWCYALTTANLPVCASIGSVAFEHCHNFVSLYLNSVSQVTWLSTNAFYSTPIGGYSESAGHYGSVLVPASLYDQFIVATNWASISSRIVAV